MEKFMDADAAVGVIEKKKFMDDNFLLSTDTAVTLYHDYAKEMPICDYHCHLNPKEIAEDKRYNNITEIWLGGDHYKWRTMRSFGIEEKYITGDATDYEKFEAFAKVMPYLIGNPMYHWSHLELKRYFGIEETLSPKLDILLVDTIGKTILVVEKSGFEKPLLNCEDFSKTKSP